MEAEGLEAARDLARQTGGLKQNPMVQLFAETFTSGKRQDGHKKQSSFLSKLLGTHRQACSSVRFLFQLG
jgi:hypothetical protein